MASEQKTDNLSEFIADNFGANATYVEGLLNRYRTDPNLVDETWRDYFADLLNGSAKVDGNTNRAGAATQKTQAAAPQTASTNGGAASKVESKKPQTVTETAKPQTTVQVGEGVEVRAIIGAAKKIVDNMEESLTVPTATSNRQIPVRLLDENRKIINDFLKPRGKKVSYTHIIAWAIVKALQAYPNLNDGYGIVDGKPSRLNRTDVNIGLAIDVEKKDGSRNLLVPNIKAANRMNFAEFLAAYDDKVKRARDNKLEIADFQGTTVSLTNPGTIGTVASQPRLMPGQSIIIATGAIEYPAEYSAMTDAALSQLGISKIINVSSTYDHRIIQGAESGLLLAHIHQSLLGEHNFYNQIFSDLGIRFAPLRWAKDFNPTIFGADHSREQNLKQAKVIELINAYRTRGHLIADIDPLDMAPHKGDVELDLEDYNLTIWDLDREFITGGLHGSDVLPLREILDIMRRAYCGKVGIEYRHIQSKVEKAWLRERIRQQFVDGEPLSSETKKELLLKLIEGEQFERFLHTKYLGQKRFSLEGCETVIPMLDQLVKSAAGRGVTDFYMGMAHRGRLNVLANIVGDFDKNPMAERIFTVFEGSSHPAFPADEGDVKYHQGATTHKICNDREVTINLSSNPSHLEFVDPVVEGMTRARQDDLMHGEKLPREDAIDHVLPILMHGDAAFAGQGIVMETLQLADLKGYRVGGTIHIVINNQIGFTTSPEASRSTIYSTDIAKMTQTPIFHINGDDPEAAFRTVQIALEYRQEFNKDVVLDVVGFRRLGHNEGDEPTYTQPLMYARVKAHPGVRQLYTDQLIREKTITPEELEAMTADVIGRYEQILKRAKDLVSAKTAKAELKPPKGDEDGSAVFETPVTAETVRQMGDKISLVPEGFHINPKMVSQLTRRAKMGAGEVAMDWAFAEAIAFGSLVQEGFPVRLSGQDVGRGTFSHRHAIMYDTETGEQWSPLAEIRSDENSRAIFQVFDSSLSEQGVLGFEYGYALESQNALVLWEAQFGDFSNGAQVIIDQYIAASEDKWGQTNRLVMLLPHGYEGQGPEHSSARLERYLQLCAENNLQVCYPTTPAQYFHLLRRQVKQEIARPLIVMTPKSLLRLPAASSTVQELTTGGFQPVIDDANVKDRSKVKRIVLCSGKVFYDLATARQKSGDERVAIVRLEQFYPFPKTALQEIFATYPNASQLIWCQEEPQNMGAWHFVADRLRGLMNAEPRFVGRSASGSPATGSYVIHELEQKKLVDEALLAEDADEISLASETEVSRKVAPASS
ncbi:MAG: multifunctional oxoglutarate decarboxylase/oxoglutarate dehydrogenase thiamine pyrophosphate-binding subunit/dihydrolipoyllysine-residue succinyltransferase subunit [Acidobacteriota bacterium]|nr:multifunctional oxoglutarate decarboxylase/oxoglutarate dehydrogenase thiamine pyrophosphate-binding subunit/dihydrolipoyllysine-residue succinyltransferase subunit [Acidobacteriota bacterium]